MREKSQLSWKEAREEATRLRTSAGSDDEDEDVEEHAQNGHHTPHTHEYGDTLPVSNIDDVHVSLPPEPQPPPPEPVRHLEVTNGPTISTSTITTNSSSHGSVENVNRSARQPTAKADDNNSGSLSSVSLEQRDSPSMAREGGPRPPDSTSAVATARAGSPGQGTPQAPRTPPQTLAAGDYQGGTLSDLKKQRQQKLQDSLRFKDTSAVNKEIQSYNANHAENRSNGRTDAPDSSLSNGRNVSRHNDSVMFGSNTGDPPRKKFTATSEIVGGADSNTSCCTIL